MISAKGKALELACQAYDELVKAGIPEQFVSLVSSVSEANPSTFFGSFGGDSGFFLEIESIRSSFTPIKMTFGVRYNRRSFLSRVGDILATCWGKLRNQEERYEICLEPDDITRLKDLLRIL